MSLLDVTSPSRTDTFHAHIFFADSDGDAAQQLRASAAAAFPQASVSRFYPGPAGPLPQASFDLTFDAAQQPAVLTWLQRHCTGRSVLIHPVAPSADDELRVHTQAAQWLGQPLVLRLDRL